jgi:sulfite exporter TauE/SafE
VTAVALVAAFVTGLAGSVHCFGMCGGMAGALGLRARLAGSHWHASLRGTLYHAGRLSGYATMGALLGTLGHSAHGLLALTRYEGTLRTATGLVTVMIAIRVLTRWNPFAPLERAGARLWTRLRPFSQRVAVLQGPLGNFATGLLWGFLPCGLVYGGLLLALTSGSTAQGAALMLALGAGTLPVMLSVTLLAGRAWPSARHRWIRFVPGAVLLAFGVWTLVAAQWPHAHASHEHVQAAVIAQPERCCAG